MKLLVLSDSHGSLRPMEHAVSRERPDYIVHLGDHDRDAARLGARFPETPLISVPGNCDNPPPKTIWTKVLDFDGVKILLTHGHVYRVKRGLLEIELAAREAGADVALFGHTHRAFCEEKDGLWLLNPGACGNWSATYGIVEIQNHRASCRLADV